MANRPPRCIAEMAIAGSCRCRSGPVFAQESAELARATWLHGKLFWLVAQHWREPSLPAVGERCRYTSADPELSLNFQDKRGAGRTQSVNTCRCIAPRMARCTAITIIMAITIAIANQKGGCGKTTTCMNLAGGLSAAGFRVLVVDADPQGSATEWRNRSEASRLDFDVIAMSTSSIHKELPKIIAKSSYEVALIDCPPGTETKGFGTVTRSALLAADVVIIPSRPTPIDFLATSIMIPVLADVVMIKPEVRVFLLLNAKHASNRLGRTARDGALGMFTNQGIEIAILDSEIFDRTPFAESPASGQTVIDFAPDSKASTEIFNLTKEVVERCLADRQDVQLSKA